MGPIRKYGVYTGVHTYTPRRRPASVWLGRPPTLIVGVPPYPAFGGLTYPLWGVYYSFKKNDYNYMQGEGLYLAAPNDGYLLLYLSYLRITP